MEDAKILIIEDDEIVARTIERSLRGTEFKITKASSGVEGLKIARQLLPDLVILDVVMPGMDGYTVCREMRADPIISEVPILFLTAKVKDQDKITGFNAGADDYLSKPFNVDELILRVRAILRRTRRNGTQSQMSIAAGLLDKDIPAEGQVSLTQPVERETKSQTPEHCLVVGDYMLDTRLYELHKPNNEKLRLTPVQYDLLYHLMTHPGQIFSPGRLLDEVWDYPSGSGSPDLVRVHIKNLRERIEDSPSTPKFIKTVPGYGYTVSPDAE
jgi:DNA-binding response OmpR family regulator